MNNAPANAAWLDDAPADVAAVISGLFIYPVKSCAGVQVQQARLTDTGLAFDREWMVVDGQGHFLTQRELPRMALIQPQLEAQTLVLHAPGMPALKVALSQPGAPVQVQVWQDRLAACDMGAVAAQWFSDFLGVSARLVRFDPSQRRICSRDWTGGVEALSRFSDGYPLLLISQASLNDFNARLAARGHGAVGMARFRPNLVIDSAPGGLELLAHDEDRLDWLQIATAEGAVRLRPVKPCPRCPIPNIDPASALSSPEVGDLLQGYRQDARVGGAPTFGMNVIVLAGFSQRLQVGQPVGARLRFE
ncbi:MAG: MOSC domain-containing protein [Polaromonas sp.]